MNNKGFTIIELLATIVILALIMTIAIPSISGITDAINRSQRQNIIQRIEIAASKYANDTGETLFFVDKLITEGYITSDDEEGFINDPVNNKHLNCYLIRINKKNRNYKAKFLDDKDYEVDNVCDPSVLNDINAELNIVVLNDGNKVDDITKWLTGNQLTLRVVSNTVIIDCLNNNCNWTSSNGLNELGVDNIEINLNNINSLAENRYTFQMTKLLNDDNTIKRYSASINLKIDNEAPIIYENEIKISDPFIYTPEKSVTIVASDGKGSGISGYYLEKENIRTCNNVELEYQESNVFNNITENGKYLVCVKDNVGNISSSTININYIKS